jgi:hypothetical protein
MKYLIWFYAVLFFLTGSTLCLSQQKTGTLVFIDKSDSLSDITRFYLLPYLDHFGIVYEIADINMKKLSRRPGDYSLVIIGHDMKNPEKASKLIRKICSKGAGVVSFDPDWPGNKMDPQSVTGSAKSIYFDTGHYITALHGKADTVKSSVGLPIKNVATGTMKPIVFADRQPLLFVTNGDESPCAKFTSMDWMKTTYIGPMMGLDDCLWRSIVWAARKPFVIRGLPPLVTMRVDDVAGRGELMQKSPFYWINTANKYGFKPWLGLFIYNLSPVAIEELRGYILNNQATAAPHALGRPNRPRNNAPVESYYGSDFVQSNNRFYYSPDALPLRAKTYDEFIYFDHNNGKPWSDEEAIRGLEAVDKWYASNNPLPMSKYFLAHFYEMGSNIIPYISDKWGMEYIGINKAINTPYADTIPWIKGGPFRLYEKPGTVTNNTALRGKKAVYYSDFVDINGYKFYNSLTEIRDDAGYEWAPDNQIEVSAGRGTRQLRRALSSMALAVLFTHETDFIYRIKPESWEEQLKLISLGISDFNPVMLTMDEALKIVRANKTSHLTESVIEKGKENINITIDGYTDTKTFVYLFTGENEKIRQRLIEIPEFTGSARVKVPVKNGTPVPASK